MKAIVSALWALLSGRGMRPWMSVKTIADIDLSALENAGVQTVVFDVDNTLTLWHGPEIHPSVAQKFEELKENFSVVIFSNTGYQKRHEELHRLFPGVLIVPQHFKKPGLAGFRKAAQLASCHPSAMVMVGDRMLTDVLGGNNAGMRAIKVEPFIGPDPWYSSSVRFVEDMWRRTHPAALLRK